jgi:ABC-2 type transport system permease protein
MVLKTNLRRLTHNRAELLLMFVVPVLFFSIFAVIFGQGLGTTPKIKVVIADRCDSERSQRIVETLLGSPGLRPMSDVSPTELSRQQAREMVRRGTVSMAIVLESEGRGVAADLLSDASDQVAGQVVSAIVSRTLAMSGANRPFPTASLSDASPPAAGVAPAAFVGAASEGTSGRSGEPEGRRASPTGDDTGEVPADREAVRIVDVMGEGKSNPVVSMYAAGIAVMFLLFGATTGGGALLEERESQTLDRLLSTQLTMDHLLLGKWFYLTAAGFLQVTVMFVWGQLVFGIDLVGHLDGFVMMTLVTAAAASAFGLFLATLCRTRGQLNGLSVVLVLTMSALGGSMVPRYVMSQRLREAGLWTFNAWALDGYDKVFWRELPVATLAPQLSVLLISAVAFLLAARLLALRWETQ